MHASDTQWGLSQSQLLRLIGALSEHFGFSRKIMEERNSYPCFHPNPTFSLLDFVNLMPRTPEETNSLRGAHLLPSFTLGQEVCFFRGQRAAAPAVPGGSMSCPLEEREIIEARKLWFSLFLVAVEDLSRLEPPTGRFRGWL